MDWAIGPGQARTVVVKLRRRGASGSEALPTKELRTMKRVVVDHYGGPDVLRVVDRQLG